MSRAWEALAKVERRVTSGRLKDPAKIGAAVERPLQRHYGYRYYAWELKEGLLRITEHPVRIAQEKKYEGKYLLQTDQAEITATEAVHQYKQLAEVERAFRTIKDPLSLRPINHRAQHRVRAHIFVAALAFLLDRFLERRLKASQTNLSTGDAVRTGNDPPCHVPCPGRTPYRSHARLFASAASTQGPGNYRPTAAYASPG